MEEQQSKMYYLSRYEKDTGNELQNERPDEIPQEKILRRNADRVSVIRSAICDHN